MGRSQGRVPADGSAEQRVEEMLSLLFALSERLRAHFESSIAEFDLSAPQAKALRYLAAAGPAPMREVAASLQCDASNVTGIVDRLERRGLVERRPGSDDRRVKYLLLTSRGHEVARRLWARVLDGAPAVRELVDADQLVLLGVLNRIDGDGAGCWCPRHTPPLA
jgi:MarR family transcriptional regulator, organic hydroperoxide resistance regulator